MAAAVTLPLRILILRLFSVSESKWAHFSLSSSIQMDSGQRQWWKEGKLTCGTRSRAKWVFRCEWNAESGGGTEKGVTRLMKINNLGWEKYEAVLNVHMSGQLYLHHFYDFFFEFLSWHHIDYAALFLRFPCFPSSHVVFVLFFEPKNDCHRAYCRRPKVLFSQCWRRNFRLMLSLCRGQFSVCRFWRRLRDERDKINTFVRSVSTNLINDVLNPFNYYLNAHRWMHRACEMSHFSHCWGRRSIMWQAASRLRTPDKMKMYPTTAIIRYAVVAHFK